VAPGYHFMTGGINEDFNGDWPPSGWSVINNVDGANITWGSSSDKGYDNWTGGTGDAAIAAAPSGHLYTAHYDAWLLSPQIKVSSLPPDPVLQYKANFDHNTDDIFDIDVSVDGGPFTTVQRWTDSHGGRKRLPGVGVGVDLAPYIPQGSTHIQLRWRMHAPTGKGFGKYAQIDDVFIGACEPIHGGLVFGQVTDKNTNSGVVGASVDDDQGDHVETVANAADPNLPAGTFLFFVPSGARTLTVTADHYTDAKADVAMADNAVKDQNFSLSAGQLETDPDHFDLHVMVNHQEAKQLLVDNAGTASARFKVIPVNAPLPSTESRATGPFAPMPRYPDGTDLSALTPADPGSARQQRPQTAAEDAAAGKAGHAIASFPMQIQIYGLGIDHNNQGLWVGSPADLEGDDADHRFLFDGTDTGEKIDVAKRQIVYMADMAFDDNTGMLWQLSVSQAGGGLSYIWELDPITMKMTGNKILVPSPQSERGLAYDPRSNTWYAGDFISETVYHFDADGKLLDSGYIGFPIQGLAYNSATGHLFVLGTLGEKAVYVIDARNNYAPIAAFDISGLNNESPGAGLGYDCDGHLWISAFKDNVVWEADSGETGWCDHKHIPWLTLTPVAGTLKEGASTSLKLTFNGTGQKENTTSEARLRIAGNTPYPATIVPLTVHWDPQPVDLAVSASASPNPIANNGNLVYTVKVENHKAQNSGNAQNVVLTYPLPSGVSFIPATGGICSEANGTVSCNLGDIDRGSSATATVAVKVGRAGKLTGTFTATANEPQKPAGDNQATVETTVIGKADLAIEGKASTITVGQTGTVAFKLTNAGPDAASNVILSMPATDILSYQSATASQGRCTVGGKITCDLGEVAKDATITVTLKVFGVNAGTGTVSADVTTTSTDPNTADNSTQVRVTAKAASKDGNQGSGGGGGSFDWLILASLLGLTLTSVLVRRR
jgi:uncharacterized repeat protein (TIGR01451 family)